MGARGQGSLRRRASSIAVFATGALIAAAGPGAGSALASPTPLQKLASIGVKTAPARAASRAKLSAQFHLKGSHHYRIYGLAFRSPRPLAKSGSRIGRLMLTATRGARSSSYTVRARFNRHRIRASLGRFGRVALRFGGGTNFVAPKAPQQERRDRICSSSGLELSGEFRGIVRFRGEGAYTRARAHRLRGTLQRYGPWHCQGHNHGTKLKAESGSTTFEAAYDPEYRITGLIASTQERSGRVHIDRYAYHLAKAEKGEFTFASDLTSAHVAPTGGPLTGSADFDSSSSWMGSLAGSFPGDDAVPLAGSEFSARLWQF